MGYPQSPPFSPVVLLTLLLVAVASSVTFWLLIRRWTSHRQWVALSDWARESGFRFKRQAEGDAPPPFSALSQVRPLVRMQLARGPTTLVQLEAGELTRQVPAGAGAGAGTGAAEASVVETRSTATWNVLIRQLESSWRPTGLRPTHAAASVLDLFSLSSFPAMGSTERFVAFGSDSAAARALSKSMARSLLPADVGLLLHGRNLVLDFSTRPFDTIEFSRMLALSDQLASRLPSVA